MSIVKKIVDLNTLHRELTGEPLKQLKLHWSYREPLEEELGFYFHCGEVGDWCMVDGVNIDFTPKPPDAPYMYGKEIKEYWDWRGSENRSHYKKAMEALSKYGGGRYYC